MVHRHDGPSLRCDDDLPSRKLLNSERGWTTREDGDLNALSERAHRRVRVEDGVGAGAGWHIELRSPFARRDDDRRPALHRPLHHADALNDDRNVEVVLEADRTGWRR